MKMGWLIALFLCVPVFAFGQRSAQATYSQNGVLIGLADLAPLRDCSVRSTEGKVRSVKQKGGIVLFQLGTKHDQMAFQFSLARLASSEQFIYHKDFLHKGLRLRASGYACSGTDGPFETITVERVY
jgi:hypothetical protein